MKSNSNYCFFSLLTLFLASFLLNSCSSFGNIRDFGKNNSAKLSPDPKESKEAVVQIFTARTFNWSALAVHSWLTFKPKDTLKYTVLHVLGWRKRSNLSVIKMEEGIPDQYWYGAEPEMIFDLRGEEAEQAIKKIKAAVKTYPYPDEYRLWPGPNSNTFIAHLIREVSELTVELPPHAIGKDWLNYGNVIHLSQTRTGLQLSILGALGAVIGIGEGIEINILGLNLGIDIFYPALKLPGIGRLGFKDGFWW